MDVLQHTREARVTRPCAPRGWRGRGRASEPGAAASPTRRQVHGQAPATNLPAFTLKDEFLKVSLGAAFCCRPERVPMPDSPQRVLLGAVRHGQSGVQGGGPRSPQTRLLSRAP